jgi:ADP-ribose pyrophosphatase YjhB (NUDIX family)
VVAVHRVDYLNDPNAPSANSIVVATSAYVEDDQQRLLLIRRRDNDLWALPGGGMEVGETVTGCAIRETKEETGLDINVTGVVGIFSNPSHVVAYPDGEVRQQFSICLRAEAVGGTIATSDESSDVSWISRAALDQLNIHPEIRRRIDRGMMDETRPHVD